MNARWRHTVVRLVFGLAAGLGFLVAARTAVAAPRDFTLSGTFVFTYFAFTGPTTAEGEGLVLVGGAPLGSFSAEYSNIDAKGQGVTHLNGQHTITLPGGTLVTSDEIRLQSDNQNPAVVRANSRLYIVGGTGLYVGASGVLHTHGEVNVITLAGGIDFEGKVYLP